MRKAELVPTVMKPCPECGKPTEHYKDGTCCECFMREKLGGKK